MTGATGAIIWYHLLAARFTAMSCRSLVSYNFFLFTSKHYDTVFSCDTLDSESQLMSHLNVAKIWNGFLIMYIMFRVLKTIHWFIGLK